MNLFGFGKKKPSGPAPPQHSGPQHAIDELDNKIETLMKRDQHIQTKIDNCKKEALAKKKRGDKTGALISLKKANRYQEETRKLQGTIMNLENQKIMLESATSDVEVLKTFEHANNTLKKIHNDVTSEKVDQIMEDMEEQNDIANQISEAMTRNTEDMFDDEELLAELDGLEEELDMVEQEKAPTIPTKPAAQQQVPPSTNTVPEAVFNFPNAPQGQLQQKAQEETEDERAIRELQESMLA